MPVWELLAVAATAWFTLAVGFALALAELLGRVARGDMTSSEYEQLLKSGAWADWPLNRERVAVVRGDSPARAGK
jgi:hypothetical protein